MERIKRYLGFFRCDAKMMDSVQQQVADENVHCLKVFSCIALIIFSGMFVASFFVAHITSVRPLYLIYMVIAIIYFIIAKLVHDKDSVQAIVYSFIFAMMFFGTLVGTVYLPSELAVDFVVLMFVVPLIFTCRAHLVNYIIVINILAYIIMAIYYQTDEMMADNLLNVIPYGVATMLVCPFLMNIKIQRVYYINQNSTLEIQRRAETERRQNYEGFINEMMRGASYEADPDEMINQFLKFVGDKLNSDRAYIFEEMPDGTFDNTYEWCREGVAAEIANLKGLPYKNLIDVWYEQYRNSHNVLIYDLEDYKSISEPMYNLLKPQGIHSLVTGSITVAGKIVGFYGVDNPPAETMEDISELLDMMEFAFSMMLRIRDNTKSLENGAIHDQLTGCRNRRALSWAYDGEFSENEPFAVIMCDLNGLKIVNDKQGHVAGDGFIKRTGDALKTNFGEENVYRIGGDEFIVVLAGDDTKHMENNLDVVKLTIGSTASIGVAYHEKMDITFEEILKEADEKMYAEKNRYHEMQNRGVK